MGRLAAALTELPALGLSRFYSQFENLKFGTAFTHPAISKNLLASIAAYPIAVTVTGIALDRRHSVEVTGPQVVAAVQADNVRRDGGIEERAGNLLDDENGPLGEVLEVLSNLQMVLVGLHIAYLLVFKWKLA